MFLNGIDPWRHGGLQLRSLLPRQSVTKGLTRQATPCKQAGRADSSHDEPGRRWFFRVVSCALSAVAGWRSRARVASARKMTVIHTIDGAEVSIPGSNPETMFAHALDKTVYPSQWPYTDKDFFRLDSSDDADFYAEPKLVKHLEDKTLAALTKFYSSVFPKDRPFNALDICSSWVSHYPPDPKPARLAITGMNAEELKRNTQATDWSRQDLNSVPKLPYKDAEFDVVTNTVSVDYLTKPLEVFTEVGRVLRPGGLAIVAFSNRCFLSKLVAIWSVGDPDDRAEVAASYFHFAGCFEDPEVVDLSPPDSDPLYVVCARRK
mmetsp:Transcript_56102/g.125199  ORF Transcript_56102/g.125199 Transcript_56102/m.125199 type:complete len:320 (+) Transcript_56102:2-961(+)